MRSVRNNRYRASEAALALDRRQKRSEHSKEACTQRLILVASQESRCASAIVSGFSASANVGASDDGLACTAGRMPHTAPAQQYVDVACMKNVLRLLGAANACGPWCLGCVMAAATTHARVWRCSMVFERKADLQAAA